MVSFDMPFLILDMDAAESCLAHERKSVLQAGLLHVLYIFCVEAALFVLFYFIEHDLSHALKTAAPVMTAVAFIFSLIIAVSVMRSIFVTCKIIRILWKHPEQAFLSGNIFSFCFETTETIGSRHIHRLYFTYKDNQKEERISFGKTAIIHDELIPGKKYRFLLVRDSYLLALKA